MLGMGTKVELLSVYQIADRIVDESLAYRAAGELELVKKAWDCSNAEAARLNADRANAEIIRAGLPCPQEILQEHERATQRAHAACEEFAREYDAFRERHARRAASGLE